MDGIEKGRLKRPFSYAWLVNVEAISRYALKHSRLPHDVVFAQMIDPMNMIRARPATECRRNKA